MRPKSAPMRLAMTLLRKVGLNLALADNKVLTAFGVTVAFNEYAGIS